jgi:hypothetical protein
MSQACTACPFQRQQEVFQVAKGDAARGDMSDRIAEILGSLS